MVFWCGTYPYWNCLACLLTPHRGNFVAALITALFPASFDHRWQYHSCGKWTVEQVPIDAAGGSLIIPPPKWEYQSEDCRLSATPWALLVQGPALMVVRDTFLAELKTLFWFGGGGIRTRVFGSESARSSTTPKLRGLDWHVNWTNFDPTKNFSTPETRSWVFKR